MSFAERFVLKYRELEVGIMMHSSSNSVLPILYGPNGPEPLYCPAQRLRSAFPPPLILLLGQSLSQQRSRHFNSTASRTLNLLKAIMLLLLLLLAPTFLHLYMTV